MLKVKAGGDLLQLVYHEDEERVFFDCAAHMREHPHSRTHRIEADGVSLELNYTRVRARLEVRYPNAQSNGAFVSGSFVNVGSIWLADAA